MIEEFYAKIDNKYIIKYRALENCNQPWKPDIRLFQAHKTYICNRKGISLQETPVGLARLTVIPEYIQKPEKLSESDLLSFKYVVYMSENMNLGSWLTTRPYPGCYSSVPFTYIPGTTDKLTIEQIRLLAETI